MNYYQFLSGLSIVYVVLASIFLIACIRDLILFLSDLAFKKKGRYRQIASRNDFMAVAMISIIILASITVVALLHYLIRVITTLGH